MVKNMYKNMHSKTIKNIHELIYKEQSFVYIRFVNTINRRSNDLMDNTEYGKNTMNKTLLTLELVILAYEQVKYGKSQDSVVFKANLSNVLLMSPAGCTLTNNIVCSDQLILYSLFTNSLDRNLEY